MEKTRPMVKSEGKRNAGGVLGRAKQNEDVALL